MHTTLTTLIDRLDSNEVSHANVIRWGSPVPSFGDLSASRVATLGLNPSNREFVDEAGEELRGTARRFHTLASLGIESWAEVEARHLEMIIESCRSYFSGNPYDRWFKRLDFIISGTKASYYDESRTACHLDLIPYATECKWTDLTTQQRSLLSKISGNALGMLLRDSRIEILILNGKSVVENFQEICGVALEKRVMASWALPRRTASNVTGVAYSGMVDTLSGIFLGRQILVLGFNHNIQSSFGVTKKVICAIRNWIENTVDRLTQ